MRQMKTDSRIALEGNSGFFIRRKWEALTMNPKQNYSQIEKITKKLEQKYGTQTLSKESIFKLNGLLNLLGPVPEKNIETVIEKASDILGGFCSIYNRLDDHQKSLCALTTCDLPPDFIKENNLHGHICYEVTMKEKDKPAIFEDLTQTSYAKSDPNIAKFGLKSYLGYPVVCEDRAIGSLCVLDDKKREFSFDEINIIATLARILSVEESHVRTKQKMKKKLVYEKMQADLGYRAIFVDNLNNFIDDCMAIIGNALGIDVISFWKYSEKRDTLHLISHWSANRLPAQQIKRNKLTAKTSPKTISMLKRNQVVSYNDADDLPAGTEIVKLSAAESILLLPIFINKDLYGFFGCEAYDRLTKRKNEEIDRLKTTVKIIARSIDKKQEENELLDRHNQLKKSLRLQAKELIQINKNLKKEIKERKQAVCALKKREKELTKKNAELEDFNTAMKIIFKRRENDLYELEDKVLHNIKQLVEPAIDEVKKCGLNKKQKKYIQNLEMNLNDITSPMVQHLSSQKYQLTPSEIRIAGLVKHGRSTKEIAEFLSVASKTVETHRLNIRKKLGISNQGKNLRVFLLRLQ
jgi:DNA-binding CsgD family transcriptional regulator/GAF domain-containing protein